MKDKKTWLEKALIMVKPIYFLAIAFIALVICVGALRANNEQMIKLRSAVYSADQNNLAVPQALQRLQDYVTHHMNTSLNSGKGSVYPPIQLKYTYQRLLENESASAAANNSQLYTEAQTYCQIQVPNGFSGRYRIPCIEQYIQSHDTTLPQIPTALYEFDFVSPTWSPDLAGWSMAIAVLSFILFLISFIVDRLYRRYD